MLCWSGCMVQRSKEWIPGKESRQGGMCVIWGKGKRRGIVLLLTAVMLSGCGVAESGEMYQIREEKPAKEEKTVLEVYAWEDEEKNLQLLSEAYLRTRPGMEIQLHVIPASEYSQQMMAISRGVKEGDCVFFPHIAEAAIWVNKGLLQNLESYIGELEAGFTDWYQGDKQEYKEYMCPYRMSRWAVFYNKKIFEEREIPYPEGDWTWEEYAQTAMLLTERVGVNRIYGAMGFEPTSSWWRVPARTRGANNPLADQDLAMFREAAKWCYDMTYERKAQLPYTEWTEQQGRTNNEVFLGGSVGMCFTGDWSVSWLNEKIEEKNLDFEYDIAPMPRWEEEPLHNISDAAVISMVKSTVHPDAAGDFIRFVCGPEGAAILAERDYIPAWDSEEIRETFLNSEKYPEHREFFFMEGELSCVPASLGYSEAMEVVQEEIMSYLLQEQSLDQCFDNIEHALKTMKAKE
ncbi:Putative ABC transporter substrate-binding protein YesO [Acetatifactor muris]|uniref:ABC transporter substrate-binding protein YesO n=2 Tax=Acetatifactor muris TaxID=879566 RepID=A0A2K4ZA51_9FIRM|nr:Putative ABC transporter substrate-binding protein YesO [Acetatifactor muris]